MDLTLIQPIVENLTEVILGVIVIASLLTAGTSTPSSDTLLGKAYKFVEFLALNFGKAKDKGE